MDRLIYRLNKLSFESNKSIVNYIKNRVQDHGIKTRYFNEYILLSPEFEHFHSQIYRECNGMLLKIEDFKVKFLVRPMEVLRYISCRIKIEKYKAYEVIDGSFINIYFENGTWLASTKTCFNIELDNHDYMLDEDFFAIVPVDQLNTEYVYQFIISSKKIHGFDDIYLLNHPNEAERLDIKQPREIENPTNDLLKKTINAPIDEELEFKYGIILRGKCGKLSNLIYETQFYKMKRELIYNQLFDPEEVELAIKEAYEYRNSKDFLKKYLPQYSNIFENCDITTDNIVDNLMGCIYRRETCRYPKMLAFLRMRAPTWNLETVEKNNMKKIIYDLINTI